VSDDQAAESAARAARRAALKPYRKFSHRKWLARVLARPRSVGTFGTCAEGVELVEVLPGARHAGIPLVQDFGEVPACHEQRRQRSALAAERVLALAYGLVQIALPCCDHAEGNPCFGEAHR
jgi:hypothetical protein